MNLLKLLTSLLVLTFSVSALAEDPIETGTFNNHAIYGYDTVAYFTDNKAVKGKKTINHEWRGADWHFASTEHRDMFIAEPEKYAPQYGGYCAYAMTDGRLVGVDEDAFTIHEGKLYLNYSISVMKEWRKEKAKYIAEADPLYPTLVDLPAN
jgi:YHS domain-containing protein